MSLGISNVAATSVDQLAHLGNALQQNVDQASSGKRITSAAVDPSGLAIATELTTQANASDQAARNVADLQNAVIVADGALAGTTDALQRLNGLAVQATNDLLSPTQRGALQSEADGLVRQINTNAQNATFNGTNLLTGAFSGGTPAQNATAQVTTNATVSGGALAANVTAAPNAQAGTVQLTVVNGSAGATLVQASFTDTATGQTTQLGTFAGGATVNAGGTQVVIGSVASTDVGQNATVQVTGAVAAVSGSTLGVQSGANEGATTNLNLPNGTSGANFIQNIDLATSASAQNAQGQIAAALASVTTARADLGAQAVAASETSANDRIAANQLTASASAIADDNAAQRATELNQLLIRRQIAFDTLTNANTEAGYLNRFFNTGV